MTQKEKAKQLVEKMIIYHSPDDKDYEAAKDCALIAVEQIKEAIFWHPYESPNFELEYWNEVKQEIEKL
jgi:hypothetical protein